MADFLRGERGGGYYRRLLTEAGNPCGGPQDIVAGAVLRYLMRKTTPGDVLDLGAGFGRHAFLFAISGVPVHCVDLDPERVEKLNAIAARERLPLRAEVRDIEEGISGSYAVIVCSFVHHYLSAGRGIDLIREMQAHTLTGGLNAVAAVTRDGDFFQETEHCDAPKGLCYFSRGELRTYYRDWEILDSSEYAGAMAQRKSNGEHYVNVSAYVLAQKP
ncbi:MAG: methyltransferase domain-containing protein [Patescibacteria group bacterium]